MTVICGNHGESMMDYDEWISRERKVRTKLLTSSTVMREKKIYRLCQDCGEVCLCHEETCPNCNCNNIVQGKLDDDIEAEVLSGKRIRCIFRFEHLN
jgi:uncharacterized OB-fold protein